MPKRDPIPVYVLATEVQRALKWTDPDPRINHRLYKKTVRWLRRARVLVNRGGRLVVPIDLLRTEFSELYDDIAQQAVEFEVL